MSPIVTWDPGREISRPPTKRPLTAAELKLGRERADRFYDVVKAAPSFSRPTKYVTLVTSWPVVADSGVVRQKERLMPPAARDPKSVYWGPRLVLEAVEEKLATLDAAGRASGACGRVDPAFPSGQDVRFEPIGPAGAGCVPMFRIRQDLVDPKRPSEIQLLNIWFADAACGEHWAGKPSLQSDRCDAAVLLMRELDWGKMRNVMGW